MNVKALFVLLVLVVGSLTSNPTTDAQTIADANIAAVPVAFNPPSAELEEGTLAESVWLGYSCGEGYLYQTYFYMEDEIGQLFLLRVTWRKMFLPGVITGDLRLAYTMREDTDPLGEYLNLRANGEPMWDLNQWKNRSNMYDHQFFGGPQAFQERFYALGIPDKLAQLSVRLEKEVNLFRNWQIEDRCYGPKQLFPWGSSNG